MVDTNDEWGERGEEEIGGRVEAKSEPVAIEMGGRVHSFGSVFGLSPREHEVLELLCRGHHPKAIAQLAGCGYASVRTHLRRIYKKVGCSGVRELMVCFFSEPGSWRANSGAGRAALGPTLPARVPRC